MPTRPADDPPSEKLQKAIARAGVMSRRAAEEAIAAQRVRVDGRVAHVGQRVGAGAVVEVDGHRLPVEPDHVYVLLHKPRHVVTTLADPEGRPTVADYVPPGVRLFPVGRLDFDSEGLLVLTNDGDFAQAISHPSLHVPKTYVAEVSPRAASTLPGTLRRGVDLPDGTGRALGASVLATSGERSLVEITVGEGRNRLVRRMLAAVGHDVHTLVRTRIGDVADPNLGPGETRPLTPNEVARLYRLAYPRAARGTRRAAQPAPPNGNPP